MSFGPVVGRAEEVQERSLRGWLGRESCLPRLNTVSPTAADDSLFVRQCTGNRYWRQYSTSSQLLRSGRFQAHVRHDQSVRLPPASCATTSPDESIIGSWGLIAYADTLDTVGIMASDVASVERVFGMCLDHFEWTWQVLTRPVPHFPLLQQTLSPSLTQRTRQAFL